MNEAMITIIVASVVDSNFRSTTSQPETKDGQVEGEQ